MTELSREALLADGYHEERKAAPYKHADSFFQKRIKDGLKTRYFISVYYYRYPDRESWHGELSTHLQDGRYVDLGIHGLTSIEDTNEFFERAFIALNGRDYDDGE